MFAMDTSRSFGIVAHVDAGKTTLSERILLHTGRNHRVVEVHDGGATTDPMPAERRHGISIQAAAVECTWEGHALTLVDTPGHVDFQIEVERSLRVLDGAVLVLCAVAGVQPQTVQVFRQLRRHGVPCLAFVNKCDRPGADPVRVVAELRERVGAEAALLQRPLESGDGVVDLVARDEIHFAGAHGADMTRRQRRLDATDRALRDALLDAASLHSDRLTEAMLEGPVALRALHAGLREATLAGFVPVLVGSAYRDVGVQPLLDAIVRYLPSPADRTHAALRDGVEVPLQIEADGLPLALAFKRQVGRHGTRTWVRVYRGALRPGCVVRSARTGRDVRIPRLVRLDAGGVQRVDVLGAGSIGAIPGVDIQTGDTLSADDGLVLPGVEVPAPVVEVAVSVRRGGTDPAVRGLRALAAEDPTLQVRTDGESGELRLLGMGELHLLVTAERLEEEHGVRIALGAPRVALRQTLDSAVRFDLLWRKQRGGAGQRARVVGWLEPRDDLDVDVRFDAGGDAIPHEYRRAITRSVHHWAQASDVPWVGLTAVFTDGETHVEDSSDQAFYNATRAALTEAVAGRDPVVLEPRMEVDVEAPPAHHGAVLRGLARRRAEIVEATVDGVSRVRAEVPLAQLFGYAGDLRGGTGGTGTFTSRFHRYARASA